MLTHLDLFSGIGGFALAVRHAGFTTVGFSEIDPFASRVLLKHWPHVPNHGDVRNIQTGNSPTVITGGFPCQPFSVAGKQQGRQDDRHLWPEFLRIIRTLKPAWVIGENVNGIVAMELDNILADLGDAGYRTRTFNIPALAAGTPHQRRRIWIVANTLRVRCNDRFNNTQDRAILDYAKQNIQTAQTGWKNLQYESWKTFNLQEWMSPLTNPSGINSHTGENYTSGQSERPKRKVTESANRRSTTSSHWTEDESPVPGMDDGLSDGVDRNKSLGNAIVPAVVYPILKSIAIIESLYAT